MNVWVNRWIYITMYDLVQVPIVLELEAKWRNTICISIIKLVYAYVQFNPLLHYQNRFYGINKLYIKQLQAIIKNNPSIILVHVYTSICYIQSQLLGLWKKNHHVFSELYRKDPRSCDCMYIFKYIQGSQHHVNMYIKFIFNTYKT